MATTDYDFISTRNELISRAFRIIGALSLGETLTAEQLDQGVMTLNAIVLNWQTDRVFVYGLQRVNVSLLAGTDDYTLAKDPPVLAIDRAAILDTGNIESPCRLISWREYQEIPNKTSSGDPTCCCYLPGQTAQTVYVYPVPTRTLTLALLAATRLQDFDAASGDGDIPALYQDALTYAVARDLADEYGIPLKERQLLGAKAFDLYRKMNKHDRDRSDGEFMKGAY